MQEISGVHEHYDREAVCKILLSTQESIYNKEENAYLQELVDTEMEEYAKAHSISLPQLKLRIWDSGASE